MVREEANLTHCQIHRQPMLVVEDEAPSRTALSRLLKRKGYDVEAVESAEEAWAFLQAAGRNLPAWVFVDVDLPGMCGLDFVKMLKDARIEVHPIMVTAADRRLVQEFCDRHAVDYFPKPLDVPRLLQHIGHGTH